MTNRQRDNEINELLFRLLENDINDDGIGVLTDWFNSDPQAIEYYCEFVNDYSALKNRVSVEPAENEFQITHNDKFDIAAWSALAEAEKTAITVKSDESEKRSVELAGQVKVIEKSTPSKLIVFSAILSTAAMLLLLLYVWIVPAEPPIVASLGYTVDAVWGQSTREKVTGKDLRQDTYYLQKGFAQILFHDGAKAILQGPADFELSSTSAMELFSGKMVANVNREAAGFTVKTPSGKVLDLGTEFGVNVNLTGNSDVHVFNGEVVLYPHNTAKKIPLIEGKAKSITTTGQAKDIELKRYSFVRQDEFTSRVKAQQGDSYYRWLAYSYQLRRDPSLVAYYTFEKDDQFPGILHNNASLTDNILDGSLRGTNNGLLPGWTSGRWPQKTALEFDRSQNHVVAVPSNTAMHINGPITVAAWLRCDQPDEGGHVVSCRLPNIGKANFQFGYKAHNSWKGRIQFARMDDIKSQSEDRVYSNLVFNHSPQWRFVVASHDNKQVRFYVNGFLIETHQWDFRQETVIADLMIGTSNVQDDTLGFTGEMGELAIFKRVLTDDQIDEMYRAGKP